MQKISINLIIIFYKYKTLAHFFYSLLLTILILYISTRLDAY